VGPDYPPVRFSLDLQWRLMERPEIIVKLLRLFPGTKFVPPLHSIRPLEACVVCGTSTAMADINDRPIHPNCAL
jgi:hypothetical protein